jgi:hypothetical protein
MWILRILHTILNGLYGIYRRIDSSTDVTIFIYVQYYVFTFICLLAVTLIWDAILDFLNRRVHRAYHRIGARGSLHAMTRKAEFYYMIRKALIRLSFGTVGYGYSDTEWKEQYIPTGPLTMLRDVRGLVRGALSINLPNVVIWLLILSYTRPSLFNYPTGFSLQAAWDKLINLQIEKIGAWVAVLLVLIAFTTSSRIRSRINFGEEALSEAQKTWARLERPFNTIIYAAKRNIERLNREGDQIVSFWLQHATNDPSYTYYDGDVRKEDMREITYRSRNRDLDPFEGYEDFSPSAEMVVKVLGELDDNGLQYPFFQVSRQ